ncbi:glycosyl hydrolase [Nocardioides sp. SOB77]|uniref:Glycosyl hydrolase n=1 Tax=Nocardioides oceani TaxID=3058369 RepID=A0ABT8FKF4_9ACTN|nr:glycosyl hydrolase [Nocardioides oceani]MDN4175156.1 glycosyl hydrolase [Nocardioides oceani]
MDVGRLFAPWVILLASTVAACGGPSTPEGSEPPAARAADVPAQERAPRTVDELVPRDGAWFGASIDWSSDTLADYAERLGHAPAVAVTFYDLPMSEQQRTWLDEAVAQARETGSMLLVTLEPRSGLASVTDPVVEELAALMHGYNEGGTPVFLRFAHEMNGSWYPWGQQPQAYVAAFRRVATAVHRAAPGTAMVWAPNYGGGYPFSGGQHEARPGTADARALDTDRDGRVTQADDPYAPYWPGPRYVDWVGMSIYHWGAVYPWGENEVPEAGKFTDLLRGTYAGVAGDERDVPDFYAVYGEGQRLPVAVTETGALYAPGRGGVEELAIKEAWWRQVFAADHATDLPWVKMITWFEWRKDEPEVGGVVDWTVTRGPVGERFRTELPAWLRYAEDPTAP